MEKGILIVFDGIDGVGKTTQVNLLKEALDKANIPAVSSKEPTNGTWGQLIRTSAVNGRLPLEKELEYFINDRKEHISTLVSPALNSGKVVILDRYYYSTIAYQGARGANVEDVRKRLEEFAIIPDVTFILDCNVNMALDRIKTFRGDTPNEFEKKNTLIKVQKVFLSLCEIEPEIKKINAQNSIGVTHNFVIDELLNNTFKKKLCLKPYESDCGYCMFKMSKNCEWYNNMALLKPVIKENE